MDDSNKNYTTATLLLFSFMGIVPLGAQAEEINQLETINVSATVESKTLAGKDEVYSKNNVTEYKSKKEIETYHSQSVSDLLSGITGVSYIVVMRVMVVRLILLFEVLGGKGGFLY